MQLSPQSTFDFGSEHRAANDPVYSNALFARAKRQRDFYGSLTAKRRRILVFQRAGWRCEACGKPHDRRFAPLQEDHRSPFGAGGGDCLANLRALYPPCHRLKTSMDYQRYGWRARMP